MALRDDFGKQENWFFRRRSHIPLLLVFVFLCSCVTSPPKGDDSIERVGDVLQIAIPSTAIGISCLLSDGEGTQSFLKSLYCTLFITHGLKYAIDRKRPDGGNHSFPSGHTSAAFSGASFLERRYGWKCGVPAYIAASFVEWSRVKCHKHYWEDVVVGAFLGTSITCLFTKPYKKQIEMYPMIGSKMYGFVLVCAW
jgi:membrane-associated phospholipid phosphatase